MKPFLLVLLLGIFSPFFLLGAIAGVAWICLCTGFMTVVDFAFKAQKQIDEALK